MARYKGFVKTNIVGSKVEFEFEVKDSATDEEIQEVAQECMWDCIEMYYEKIDESEGK